MRAFLRVAWLARRRAVWALAAAAAMALAAAATVFALNLVRPLYDRVLVGSAPTPAVPRAPLVRWLDRWASELGGRLSRRPEGGPWPILGLMLAAVAVKGAATFVARYATARLGLAAVRDLRDLTFEAIVRQDPAFFATVPSGTLLARVVHDARLVQEALAERLGDVVQSAVTLVGVGSYLAALDAHLFLALLAAAPLYLVPLVHLARRLRGRSRQTQERIGEVAALLSAAIRGMGIVQAFGAERWVSARYRRATAAHARAALGARALQLANAPVMEVLGALGALALVAYAGTRIQSGTMTLGDLSAFVLGAWAPYAPIKNLNQFNLALARADVASARVLEVVERRPQVRDAPGARALRPPVEGIRFEDVWFAYRGRRWVLRGLNLEVPAGATVALVGPSGAGKSTVLHLILRFWDPQRGRVLLGGRDVRTVTLESLRAHVALVEQDLALFRGTVRDNIAAGRTDVPPERIEAAARAAEAHGFILRLPAGYDSVLGEGGATLSGGERQRLAIARALLREPAILLLDEPTAALDADTERRVQEELSRLSEGRTVLVVAHRVATVRRADEIVVLERGEVVERGSFDELIRRGGRFAAMAAGQLGRGEA